MMKTTRQPKTPVRTVVLACVLFLLAFAPSVQATPDAAGGTAWIANVSTTIQSWIDSLAELVAPPEPPAVGEAGVDIEPNG